MQRFGGKFINGFQNLRFLHGFRGLTLHCSSNSTSISTNSFEINSVSCLGFSHFQAFSTSSKLSNQNHKLIDLKTSLDSNSMVRFFKDYGFDETLIRKIVSSFPKLLCSNVDKTLKPKFVFFENEGFSRDDIIHIISANPFVLMTGLDSTNALAIRILRQFLICDAHVISVLIKLKFCNFGIVNNLLPNIDLLSSYGISIEVIRKHLVMRPSTFCQKPETFRDNVTRVDKRLGISRDSPQFMYGIHLACTFSEEDIEPRIQMFKSFGWTQSDVELLMMKNATCFGLSDNIIKKKLGFLMNELGLDPVYLANHTCLLTLSLEKRILPRHHVLRILKAKRLLNKSPNFYSVASMTESRFLNLFVLPFKEVHQVYANHIGCTVESLTQKRADNLQ